MKKVPVTMGLVALALLLVSGAKAQGDITITWVGPEHTLGTGYLPKVASDGENNVATIDQINQGARAHAKSLPNGISAFQFQVGALPRFAGDPVSWATGGFEDLFSPPKKHAQIGLAPSIALTFEIGSPECDTAIEVHQGGQDNDGSLWYQLGSNCPPFSDISWLQADRIEFTGLLPISKRGDRYVTGYNATVAADHPQSGESLTTTVVEVHQEAEGESALSYEVGVLTLGSSPSVIWSPTTEIMTPSFPVVQGSVPTVSVANNLAVLVFEGTGGTLFYSIGVVDTATSTIAWTDPVMYDTGYNPTVSVFAHFGILSKGPVLVEAHQSANLFETLEYSAGVVTIVKGSPPSIAWSTSVDNIYSAGCNPSVALSFDGVTPPNPNGSTSNLSVTETHETACGTATVEGGFGYLVQTPAP